MFYNIEPRCQYYKIFSLSLMYYTNKLEFLSQHRLKFASLARVYPSEAHLRCSTLG
jgi:hypothetical protein